MIALETQRAKRTFFCIKSAACWAGKFHILLDHYAVKPYIENLCVSYLYAFSIKLWRLERYFYMLPQTGSATGVLPRRVPFVAFLSFGFAIVPALVDTAVVTGFGAYCTPTI